MVNEHISEAVIKIFALFNEKEPPPKIALVLDIENIIHEAIQADRLKLIQIHADAAKRFQDMYTVQPEPKGA